MKSKRILLPSLLLGAFAATAGGSASAQAQTSNVTIYGTVDQYLGYIHSSTGKSVIGANDGAILRSRIGLRGTEDLGEGYAAIFNLENGFGANTGAQGDSTRLFDRQAWVGMKAPSGEYRIGRQNSVPFFIGGAIDYTERTTYGSIINTFGVPSRFDNDLSYKSPRFANFQVDVHYAMPETAGEGFGRRGIYQLGLDYTSAPFRAGYAGLIAKPNANATYNDNVVYHNVYFNYDYGPGKIYLAYVRSNNSTSSSNGNNAGTILNNVSNPNNFFAGTDANVKRFYNIYQISADYRVTPQLRVGALYGVIVDTSGNKAGASGGNVGAYYDLSKRTTLYSFLNYMKNEANGGFRFSGSAGPTANLTGSDINGKSLVGVQMGILHRF